MVNDKKKLLILFFVKGILTTLILLRFFRNQCECWSHNKYHIFNIRRGKGYTI